MSRWAPAGDRAPVARVEVALDDLQLRHLRQELHQLTLAVHVAIPLADLRSLLPLAILCSGPLLRTRGGHLSAALGSFSLRARSSRGCAGLAHLGEPEVPGHEDVLGGEAVPRSGPRVVLLVAPAVDQQLAARPEEPGGLAQGLRAPGLRGEVVEHRYGEGCVKGAVPEGCIEAVRDDGGGAMAIARDARQRRTGIAGNGEAPNLANRGHVLAVAAAEVRDKGARRQVADEGVDARPGFVPCVVPVLGDGIVNTPHVFGLDCRRLQRVVRLLLRRQLQGLCLLLRASELLAGRPSPPSAGGHGREGAGRGRPMKAKDTSEAPGGGQLLHPWQDRAMGM
mmetsp:Transcript_21572/g.61093  ORF Transcript_21572/g.61093 Transcript_21572/m.61093 type:complete len:338 (-) Transcript_21572:42-1055(-)